MSFGVVAFAVDSNDHPSSLKFLESFWNSTASIV
jgi:hypothetical protein